MNSAAERLGQTLHKMASIMLKDSGFDLRYWPKLVLTANYLQNRRPVVGRSLTPYEAGTGHKPSLAIFVELDRLVYHNLENLIQAGGIGKIKQNVTDFLNMKGIILIA